MKKLMSFVLVMAVTAPLAGCLVRTGPRHGQRQSYARSCPPAHHWDGYACVHNGKGRHKGHR